MMLRDSVATAGGPPLLKHLLLSICDNVSRGLSQAKGMVVIALSEPPESYINFLQEAKLMDPLSDGSPSWFGLLDCYTDPLGWEGGSAGNDESGSPIVCRTVRNLDGLLTSILHLGKASVQSSRSKNCFTIFIDSVSVLLRYHDMTAVTLFLQALRSTDQVTGVCWLVHGDLHDPRTMKGFEYNSSTTIAVEPYVDAEGERKGGMVTIGQKRRNGRVRENVERFDFVLGCQFPLWPL